MTSRRQIANLIDTFGEDGQITFKTRYGGIMQNTVRVFVDKSSGPDFSVVTAYKGSEKRPTQAWPPSPSETVISVAAFYCPYIPLMTSTSVNPQTMAPVQIPPPPTKHDVEEVSVLDIERNVAYPVELRTSWWFFLRCDGANFTSKAREAFDWLMTLPKDLFELSHTTLPSERKDGIYYGPMVVEDRNQRHVAVKFTSKETASLFKLFFC